jgi:hypothetical protein
MRHRFTHGSDRDTVVRAAKRAFEAYRTRYPSYDLRMDWTGPYDARVTFRAKGIDVSCAVSIRADHIETDLEVPFLFRIFQKRATAIIEREAHAFIAQEKANDRSS